jgi:hypothetical protein
MDGLALCVREVAERAVERPAIDRAARVATSGVDREGETAVRRQVIGDADRLRSPGTGVRDREPEAELLSRLDGGRVGRLRERQVRALDHDRGAVLVVVEVVLALVRGRDVRRVA